MAIFMSWVFAPLEPAAGGDVNANGTNSGNCGPVMNKTS